MAEIQFGEQTFNCSPGETALDTLLRNHIQVPWSCRAGLCHSCLVQATEGEIPPAAQRGLTAEQQEEGLLLACQCFPQSSLSIQPVRRALQPMQAIITASRLINPTLLELTFSPRLPVNYRPGQFLSLSLEKEAPGSRFTLVSRPWAEPDLQIHVARKAGGDFSSWLFDEAHTGQTIWLKGLGGECCFQPDHNHPLILFGAEQGIGAALAVAEDAHWHNQNTALKVFLKGDIDEYRYDLPKGVVEKVNKETLHTLALLLLNNPRFKGARWLLFGKPKPVLGFTVWLGENGLPREQVLPLAYRSGP